MGKKKKEHMLFDQMYKKKNSLNFHNVNNKGLANNKGTNHRTKNK